MSRRLERRRNRRTNIELLETRRLLSGGHWHGHDRDALEAIIAQVVAQFTGPRGDELKHDDQGDQHDQADEQNGIAADNVADDGTVTPVDLTTPAAPDTSGGGGGGSDVQTPGTVVVTLPQDGVDAPITEVENPLPIIDFGDPASGGGGGGGDSVAGDGADSTPVATDDTTTPGDMGDSVGSTEGQDDGAIPVADSGLPTGDDVSGAIGGDTDSNTPIVDAGDTTDPTAGGLVDSGDDSGVIIGDAGGVADPGVFNDGDVVTTVDTTPTDTNMPTTTVDTTDVTETPVTPPPVVLAPPIEVPPIQSTQAPAQTTQAPVQTTQAPVQTTYTPPPARPAAVAQAEPEHTEQTQSVQRSESIPSIASVSNAAPPPVVTTTSDVSNVSVATAAETKVVHHESAQAAAVSAKSSSASAQANPSVTGPVLPPARSSSATPAPAAPSAAPSSEAILDSQQLPLSAEVLAASGGQAAGWAWLFNNGLYGRIVGGTTDNAEKPGTTPRIVHRRVLVDGEAVSEFTQVDPAAAALAAQVQLAGDSIDTLADASDQIDEAGEPQRPAVVAGIVPAIENPTDTTTRNFLAAALAGTAVLVVQVHQWRERKLAAAASKLADLLQFDPLAVWLDEPTERHE